jgi:uncharacterized protein (DUF362 family)
LTSQVAVVKGNRGNEPVFNALDLVDFKSAVAGFQRALIKVNFICEKSWETGATTDPIVVEAIWKKLDEAGIEASVVESDATITSADKAFLTSGMKEMCTCNGIEFINLRHLKDKVKLQVPKAAVLRSITVPRIVTESAVISAAKLKTHSATTVTLGMKNMFGLLPDKFKGKYHAMGISNVVVDINATIKPALTVVDGFVGMEGNGPIDGEPVEMNLIVAGKDVVAVDASCSRVMGFDPHNIKHICRAHERGLGELNDIEIVGEPLKSVTRRFKPA